MIEDGVETSKTENFVTRWRQACFHPTSFFRQLPRDGSVVPALIYYLVLAVIVAGVNLFWKSLFNFIELTDFLRPGIEDSARTNILDFLLTPLFATIAIFLVTGVCHGLLALMRGTKHGFQTSLRVFAYSYSPAVFAVVPIAGPPVGFVWMVVLAIIGLREAQETDGAKAATAVLVPVFALLIFLVVAALTMVTLGLLKTRI